LISQRRHTISTHNKRIRHKTVKQKEKDQLPKKLTVSVHHISSLPRDALDWINTSVWCQWVWVVWLKKSCGYITLFLNVKKTLKKNKITFVHMSRTLGTSNYIVYVHLKIDK